MTDYVAKCDTGYFGTRGIDAGASVNTPEGVVLFVPLCVYCNMRGAHDWTKPHPAVPPLDPSEIRR